MIFVGTPGVRTVRMDEGCGAENQSGSDFSP